MNINYAMVSAFERSKDEGRRSSSTHVFTVLLMAVFFVALMGGLAAGASIYSSVAEAQARADALHMQSGLMANTVHVNDTVYAVEAGEGPEGRALVLVEALESGTYETRIYRYKGNIFQEYAIAGNPYNPTNGTALFKSDTFDFTFDGKLLTITTDLGSFDVALRSRQAGSL